VLWELRVRNLGVIDDVTIALGPGMTALTGETGAGKTLLVEALSLLLGGRADGSVVRTGTDEALVEGRFVDDADGGEDEPTETVLARSVVAAGRSRAWIDGRMATVGALAEAGAALVELHGQHQHQALVRPAAQRAALDRFGGIDLSELLGARDRVRRLDAEAEALGGDALQRAREADLLRYQIAEIDEAAIVDGGEDDRLADEEDRLAAAAGHREAAATALEAVAEAERGSAVDRLADASGALAGRAPLEPLASRLRTVMAELSDLATELRGVVETWDDDPERLDAVRARRQRFHELGRKYGTTLDEVLAFARSASGALAALESAEARAVVLDAERSAAREALARAEEDVARRRREAAPHLAAAIQRTLRELAMPSARVEVAVGGDGAGDEVVFLLGANPGEPLLPLAKVASGGELSRTMLAVRLALSDAPGVLVFDEVDAGIGGVAATAVGEALARLAGGSQVLVVTHLAQVAAHADHQLVVSKVERQGRTTSEVTEPDAEGRVVELSRMLSGHPESDAARSHARELLDRPAGGGRTPAS